ncbi:MAG: DEAD/DEAH box helicase [Candidatus Njordarchaeota archaeon]
MEKYSCPKCSSTLQIKKYALPDGSIRVTIYCPNCGYFREIIAKKTKDHVNKNKKNQTKDIQELPKIRLSNLSPDCPKAIREIVSFAEKNNFQAYVPVYYIDLYDEPPEYGSEISANLLTSLGFNEIIAKKLRDLLFLRNIFRFYKYQEEAIRSILQGEDVIIVAQTAMGKTEAFLLPALQIAFSEKQRPSILAIYPTKALARDQFSKFKYYATPLGLSVDVIDGDTPWSQRIKIIRSPPNILITNFDMIHYWLPRLRTKSGTIAKLFLSARLLIIDEVHQYYGAFGTHVHYILKRLSRLIEKMRHDKIQFILSSATILNPNEFGEMLIGRKIKTIVGRGRRTSLSVLFVYSFDAPFRTSAKILADLVRYKIKSLAFFNTRNSAELAYSLIKRQRDSILSNMIRLHRAGLPTKIRIKIETDFRKDRLLGLICTPTLELGVDIGNVSAVISLLTPVDRFIQRSGRAGRRGAKGSAVLILRSDDPISDYYARNPHEYFRDITGRYLEPRNKYIAKKHIYLLCYEKNLYEEDIKKYNIPPEILRELETEGAIIRTKNCWIANGALFHKYFSKNIRGIDIQIEVILNNKKIDEREILLALKELYPGAIYLNQGRKYLVKKLDLDNRKAYVAPAPREYEFMYTKPLYSYGALPLGTLNEKKVCGTIIYHGPLRMRITTWGYLVFKEGQKKPILLQELDNPISFDYPTYGLFFKAPTYYAENEDDIAGAYHATEHILIEGTYRITGGSEHDLGGISYGTTGIIVIHEALPGGNGVSSLLFSRFKEAVQKSYDLLRSPNCLKIEHLNKCVFSYYCGNNNQPLNQKGAREILEKMINNQSAPNAEKAPEILKTLEKGIA